MQTVTRYSKHVYTIRTADVNPDTGEADVLATISEDYRHSWHLHLEMPQHYIQAASMPLPVVDEAKRYLAACELDSQRRLIHPDVCNECSGFIPAAAPECPNCAAYEATRAEGKRRLAQMFPGNPPEVTAAFEEGERLGERILRDLHDAENTFVTFG